MKRVFSRGDKNRQGLNVIQIIRSLKVKLHPFQSLWFGGFNSQFEYGSPVTSDHKGMNRMSGCDLEILLPKCRKSYNQSANYGRYPQIQSLAEELWEWTQAKRGWTAIKTLLNWGPLARDFLVHGGIDPRGLRERKCGGRKAV